jgi:hypothetical protein
MATLTVYPDPHPETTSMSISVGLNSAASAWATLRDATDGGYVDISDYPVKCYMSATTNKWDEIKRTFLLFDTSALTASATISAATISLKGDGSTTYDQEGTAQLGIVATTPASNTSATTADYDQFGTTELATRVDFGSWSTSAYNDLPLNATGIAAISKTGVSKFGARISWDTDNAEPTWNATKKINTLSWVRPSATSSTDPKLVITYTLPATSNASFLLLMV